MGQHFRALFLACLAGCTTYGATNSPVTDANAIALPAVLGTWADDDSVVAGSGDLCLTLEPTEAPTSYRLRNLCEDSGDVTLTVQFARFGGELMAVARRATSDSSLPGDDSVLLLYNFFRIRIDGDSMFIRLIDADSLRSYLKAHPGDLEFALLGGNGPDLLVTDTSAELAQFLAAHARDAMLWGGEDEEQGLQRIR